MDTQLLSKQLAVYFVMGMRANRFGLSALEIAEEALSGGVTMLQWREKSMPFAESLPIAREVRRLCQQFAVPFIVNDRIDVAMLLQADGVHLGQEDVPLADARTLLGRDGIIGISAGTFAEAQAAATSGADYLGVGAVYATATKKDAGAPIGTSLIAQIHRELAIPKVGIGGIHAENARAVLVAGAEGIAVVSAISEAPDVKAAAATLRKISLEGSAR